LFSDRLLRFPKFKLVLKSSDTPTVFGNRTLALYVHTATTRPAVQQGSGYDTTAATAIK
jgi:hypothetical protein